MDLSKAFDKINHSLLLVKLKVYGFSDKVLSLLQSYLSNRFQRSRINGSFSGWNEVITRVPQGSIIQAVLLISVFEQRLSFLTSYFMTNDH